jgi:hypothetical protein
MGAKLLDIWRRFSLSTVVFTIYECCTLVCCVGHLLILVTVRMSTTMASPSKAKTKQVPAGFRAPPKPKFDPTKLSERELQDIYRRNQNILESCCVRSLPSQHN